MEISYELQISRQYPRLPSTDSPRNGALETCILTSSLGDFYASPDQLGTIEDPNSSFKR
jgi:hypothetical protein